MDFQQIAQLLQSKFSDAIEQTIWEGTHVHVVISSASWLQVAKFLQGDEQIKLDLLRCITAIDYLESNRITVVYDLISIAHRHSFAVKVHLDRSRPTIASVSQIWPTANWHEREAFDLMGVVFEGHPDLRRILLPDDWPGHPLRKDYVEPEEYHGITIQPKTTKTDNG